MRSGSGGVGRPDRLVGLLGALVGARIRPRLLGHVGRPVPLLQVAAGHVDRLAGEVRRVGSHVGDQAHAAFVGQVDALVELLGDPHRAVGGHAETARRGLLQRAGDERWIRLRPGPRHVDRLDGVAGLGIGTARETDDASTASLARFVGFPDQGDVEQAGRFGSRADVAREVDRGGVLGLDLQRRAADLHEVTGERAVIGEPGHPVADQRRPSAFVALRHEGRPVAVEAGCGRHVERHAPRDLPRFRRRELANLQLAIDHDPGCHALHASGREPAGHLLPEDRRDLVADDPVDDPAGLLRLHAGHVDGPRRLEGPLHLRLRDRVERHPLGSIRVDPEHLCEVPRDRLALSVQVGREPDVTGSLGKLPQFRDRAGLVAVDFVGGGEVVLHIHARHRLLRAFGRPAGQIADVADRRLHHESRPQILLDRLGLGRAFDDHQLVVALRNAASARAVTGLPGRTAATRSG